MTTACTHLLYLHGFRSSPESTKARQMRAAIRTSAAQTLWCCPQLPPSPCRAAALILEQTAHWPAASMAVVGSSLGGFYATWLAEQMGCPAVLLNPAIHPARDLASQVGELSIWQRPWERFEFRPEYLQELQALEVAAPTRPQRYLVLTATGDQVLDWRETARHFAGAQLQVLQGSNHGLSDFALHIPKILAFLGIAPGAAC